MQCLSCMFKAIDLCSAQFQMIKQQFQMINDQPTTLNPTLTSNFLSLLAQTTSRPDPTPGQHQCPKVYFPAYVYKITNANVNKQNKDIYTCNTNRNLITIKGTNIYSIINAAMNLQCIFNKHQHQ